MIHPKPVTPPALEAKIREKARTYRPCFSTVCPLRERCLHTVVLPYIPQDNLVTTSINLCHPQAETAECTMFRSAEPAQLPWGLTHIYHDMPGRVERSVKNHLILTYGRKRYYEYHNGTRPITPDIEEVVRQVCRDNGWTADLHFDGYIEDYVW